MNPFSALKNLPLWLLLAGLLTLVSGLLTSPRQFGLVRGGPLKEITQGDGWLCSAPFPQQLPGSHTRRFLPPDHPFLGEDGRPLSRPDSGRKGIERYGEGRFRIAKDVVQFSSSDGTSPVQNGRSYRLAVSALSVPEWLLLTLWAVAALAWLSVAVQLSRQGRPKRLLRLLGQIPSLFQLANGQPMLERLSRFLLPIPFFAGIGIGLAVCLAAGNRAAGVDLYGDRSRFLFQVSPEGYIYPTVDNLLQFIRGKASTDKTLVLVAGSSILLGVGQQEEHLWTNGLQKELGDEFAVVNISFRGAKLTSAGLPLAEMLSKEYSRWCLVTDTPPCTAPDWLVFNGSSSYVYPYDYIVWQSWLSGNLLPNGARDAELTSALSSKNEPIRLHAQENLTRAFLEKITFSSNLWNSIGYRHFFTAYSFILPRRLPFWSPRRLVADDEHEESDFLPVPQRFESVAAVERPIIDGMYVDKIETLSDGSLRIVQSAKDAIGNLERIVPDAGLRGRMLFLVTSRASYLVETLDADKKAKHDLSVNEWVRMLDRAGFNAMPLGLNYAAEDYIDGSHFSNKASARMAVEVAGKLRTMTGINGASIP